MKTKKIDKPEKFEYPKIMESKENGIVVLFSKEHTGIVIYIPENSQTKSFVGECSNAWAMPNFRPTDATFELANE